MGLSGHIERKGQLIEYRRAGATPTTRTRWTACKQHWDLRALPGMVHPEAMDEAIPKNSLSAIVVSPRHGEAGGPGAVLSGRSIGRSHCRISRLSRFVRWAVHWWRHWHTATASTVSLVP